MKTRVIIMKRRTEKIQGINLVCQTVLVSHINLLILTVNCCYASCLSIYLPKFIEFQNTLPVASYLY